MDDETPQFPPYHIMACLTDETPPLIISTNLYGELHCTRCTAGTCRSIFAKQISTGYQVHIHKLDESVRDRIKAAFAEQA